VDGILVIDKQPGMTSHDVVSRVRKILKTRRVGHTGTLDPFATGVLVVLVGKATRLAQFLDKDRKEYIAEIRFGWETDTGDRTGIPNAERGTRNAEFVDKLLAEADWETVLPKFRGDIMQTPPMYSAKKIEGKKLYELARKGVTVERKPVAVTIHELELLQDDPRNPGSAVRIRVACSAGTYVRTLAEEIGRAIGTGAHLLELRRVAAGGFSLDRSLILDALKAMGEPEKALLPIEQAVSSLAEFELPHDRLEKTRNGLSTRVEEVSLDDGQHLRLVDANKNLIAIGRYDASEKNVKPKIVLV
jgi:tRNA pseudouridine55 synthase